MAKHKSITDKNKFPNLWEDLAKQKNLIISYKDNNAKIEVQFRKLPPIMSNFKKITRLDLDAINEVEFDWTSIETFPQNNPPSLASEGFKEWELVLNRFDIRLLPFIRTELMYQRGGASDDQLGIGDSQNLPGINSLYRFKTFQIEDVDGISDENIKKVTMRESMWIRDANFGVPDFLVKLLVYFSSPNDYR